MNMNNEDNKKFILEINCASCGKTLRKDDPLVRDLKNLAREGWRVRSGTLASGSVFYCPECAKGLCKIESNFELTEEEMFVVESFFVGCRYETDIF